MSNAPGAVYRRSKSMDKRLEAQGKPNPEIVELLSVNPVDESAASSSSAHALAAYKDEPSKEML